VVTESLVGAAAGPDAERLGRREQPKFIGTRESMPLRLGFARGLNAFGGITEGAAP